MGRRRRQKSAPAPAAAPGAGPRAAAVAAGLFGLAVALRMLRWATVGDRTAPFDPAYPGDSQLWIDWARAIRAGVPFQLDLPLQPPGTAYLAALLGAAPGVLRVVWCLLGAAAVALFYLAIRRGFGARAALVAGLALALATSPILLSTSVDSEAPYLILVALSLWLGPGVAEASPAPGRLVLWGALQGLACLFRVEHALFAALLWLGLALRGWRRGDRPSALAARTAVAAAAAAALLLPWHLAAWRNVARLNREAPTLSPAEAAAYAAVEARTAHLPWEEEARRWREGLPAFARRPAALFVAATAVHRGASAVGAAEVAALEEAFGALPRPLPERFFVSIYGPLNFALAHDDGTRGRFSTRRLELPPPLAGGAHRYPPELVGGLPPPELALSYPPHLALVLDGYRVGARWIRDHPGQFLRDSARKLASFWEGAASGLGPTGFPAGLAAPRRVDVAAHRPGPVALVWQLGILALVLAGAWRAGRRPELGPWWIYLASKLAATVLFFGYARQGALAAPVVALLAALAFVAPAAADANAAPPDRGRSS
jgi:hypothetical protein